MAVSGILSDTSLKMLRLATIRPYVESHGWHRGPLFRDVLAVFERDGDGSGQLLVPTNPDFDDFPQQMRSVITKIAAVENRSPEAVAQDLLALDVDILRFTVREMATAQGTLPLEQGVSLLEGVRRSLLAAACSVLAPELRYHPRMSLGLAEDFVRLCELGQTEPGSFTINVRCPLAASDLSSGRQDDAPFARRATEMLVASVIRLVKAMDQDGVDTLFQASPSSAPVTANLCEALLLTEPQHERASIVVSASWASLYPSSVSGGQVALRAEHFPVIRDVSKRLRGRGGAMRERFLAEVDELRGVMGEDGLRQGDVRLTVYHEGEAIRTRVSLDPARYEIALRAHMTGRYLVASGTLDRGPRVATLTDVGHLDVLDR